MNELEKIKFALSEVIREENVENWINSKNKAFNDEKPIDLINQGRQDEIWQMIYFLKSGSPF